jgi:hypothetical protein
MKYIKGKVRAMTGHKIAEEKERDASQQLRRDKKAPATLEAQEEKRREQEKLERLVGLLIHSYNSASIVLEWWGRLAGKELLLFVGRLAARLWQ